MNLETAYTAICRGVPHQIGSSDRYVIGARNNAVMLLTRSGDALKAIGTLRDASPAELAGDFTATTDLTFDVLAGCSTAPPIVVIRRDKTIPPAHVAPIPAPDPEPDPPRGRSRRHRADPEPEIEPVIEPEFATDEVADDAAVDEDT